MKADRAHWASLLLWEFSELREEEFVEDDADRQTHFRVVFQGGPSGPSCLKSGSVWSALCFMDLSNMSLLLLCEISSLVGYSS